MLNSLKSVFRKTNRHSLNNDVLWDSSFQPRMAADQERTTNKAPVSTNVGRVRRWIVKKMSNSCQINEPDGVGAKETNQQRKILDMKSLEASTVLHKFSHLGALGAQRGYGLC
jgi:hypothetical protein